MSETLFDRNLRLFAERFPRVHAKLAALTPTATRPVVEGGEIIDIDLRSARLYGGDGRMVARQGAEAYLKAPQRIGYTIPRASTFDSMISRRVFDRLVVSFRDNRLEDVPLCPSVRTGFLVILGVGLGHHLPVLLEGLDVPHVVIAEAVDEFLLHSLHAFDWEALVHGADARGQTIELVCDGKPDALATAIAAIFHQHGTVYLDGSHFFIHYPLWTLEEVRRRLVNELPRQMIALGYFEDERKMIWNTATNLHKVPFRLLVPKERPFIDAPVFLVGAGPSFDDAAETLRHWRDRAIVISSGSALQTCLKNGIIPDFHTEIENTPNQYDKMKHMLEANRELFPDGKFTGITLVASSTLNPRVAQYFDDIYYFFRDSVTSSTSLGRNFPKLYGVAPTVANTSLTVAAVMGFREAYMFGFDCGWRSDTDHHAKDTIYYTSGQFKTATVKSVLTLRGNFGGQIQTNFVMDWSRAMLERAIAATGMTVFNCSDGAYVEGAAPKVPEAIHLKTPPLDRRKVVAGIHALYRPYAPGEFYAGTSVAPFIEELEQVADQLMAVCDQALAEGWSFHQTHDRLWPCILEAERDRMVAGLLTFTAVGELKLGAVFLNRIADADAREAVTRDFITLFRTLMDEMRTEARTILEEAQQMFDGGPDPWWTAGRPITSDCSY